MTDRVKGLAEIKEEEESDKFTVHSNSDIVCKFNECCLSTVVFTDASLHAVMNIVCFNMNVDLLENYVFQSLREKVEE